METIEYTITDDFGNVVYLDHNGETVECEGCISCYDAINPWDQGQCGECWGGTDRDPYVNGNAISWQEQAEMMRRERATIRGF